MSPALIVLQYWAQPPTGTDRETEAQRGRRACLMSQNKPGVAKLGLETKCLLEKSSLHPCLNRDDGLWGLPSCPGVFPRELALRPWGGASLAHNPALLSAALLVDSYCTQDRLQICEERFKDPQSFCPPPPPQSPAEQEGVPGYLCCCAGQFQLRLCPGLHVACHPSPGALLGSKPASDQNPGILVWGKGHALSWEGQGRGAGTH